MNKDPLAELARLIGQDDPFAELGRQVRQGTSSRGSVVQPHIDAPQTAPEWHGRSDTAAREEDWDAAPYERAPMPVYQPAPEHDDQRYHEPGYDDRQHDERGAYQAADYASGDSQQSAYGYETDGYYRGDSQVPPDEEMYDEAPLERRRSGLTIVAAVVGLAVIGTAGVFGYRAWTGPSVGETEPPVIKAEATPTKVVPPTPSGDQSNKQIYDRIGDRGGEKVVPREEQPVDVRGARPAPGPLGANGAPNATGSVLPPLAAPAAPPAAISGTEPKKVKTVPIRPDTPAGGTPSAAPAVPPSRVATGAPAVPSSPVQTRSAGAPAQTAPARSQSANAESGNYVVQVASQRSEADAQASYRALQAKYPSVLGGRQAAIRRADLGDKGVYYRAQIGPFATQEEASEMCGSLKAAGGQCIVQKN